MWDNLKTPLMPPADAAESHGSGRSFLRRAGMALLFILAVLISWSGRPAGAGAAAVLTAAAAAAILLGPGATRLYFSLAAASFLGQYLGGQLGWFEAGAGSGAGLPALLLLELAVLVLGLLIGHLQQSARVLPAADAGPSGAQHSPAAAQVDALIQASRIAAAVGRIRELDPLLAQAAATIQARFDLEYVQIFLADATMRSLHLKAGTGEIGQQLLAQNHRLPIGPGSINGQAAFEKKAILEGNSKGSATTRAHPLLSEMAGELAVPLLVDERIIGVLHLLSSRPDQLNPALVPSFEALAVQLAVAIENARLFHQLDRSQQDILLQALRLNRQEWEIFFDRGSGADGLVYRQEAAAADPEAPRDTIALSIESGGLPIGKITLETESAEALIDEDYEFMTTIASQVAQRVENLRLLSEADRYRREAETALKRMTHDSWADFPAAGGQGESASGAAFALEDEQPRPVAPLDPVNGEVIIPLTVQGETIGRISVQQERNEETDEILAAIGESLSDHLENLRLTAETERRAGELAIINRVNETIRGRLEPAELFQAVGEELRRAFHTTTTYIATYDGEAQLYTFPYFVIDDENGRQEIQIEPQKLGRGLTSYIIESREPLLINAQNAAEMLARGALEVDADPIDEATSFLGVPILVGEEVLGVISIQDSANQRQFTERDLALLSTISAGLGITIQNARLFQQNQEALASARRQSQELEAINRVVVAASATQNLTESIQAVANELLNVTVADQVGIALKTQDGQALRVVAASGGGETAEQVIGQIIPIEGNLSTQEVLRTRRTQVFENAQEHPMLAPVHEIMKARHVHSLASLPLITPAGVIGTVGLDVTDPTKSLTPAQLQLAETIVLQASAIIESNRLFTETEKLAERERQLRRITDRIRRGLDRESILKIAREEISRFIGASRSDAWLGPAVDLQNPAEDQAAGDGERIAAEFEAGVDVEMEESRQNGRAA